MIHSFADAETRSIFFDEAPTPATRRKLPVQLWRVARRKLIRLDAATQLSDLGNRLEKLAGDRRGQWAIRINRKYRICFAWKNGPVEVEITDYH